MTHKYNTRSKMVDTVAITQEGLRRLEQKIIDSLKDEISNMQFHLKDEINNLKGTVIKSLQEEIRICDKSVRSWRQKELKLRQSRIIWLSMKEEITL